MWPKNLIKYPIRKKLKFVSLFFKTLKHNFCLGAQNILCDEFRLLFGQRIPLLNCVWQLYPNLTSKIILFFRDEQIQEYCLYFYCNVNPHPL